MQLSALFKPLSSFRAQMVAFIVLILILTTVVLYLVNVRAERRITRQVDEYIHAITQATDIVYRSFSEGTYIYNIVNQPDSNSLAVNDESIIRHILVVESNGNIFDSTDRNDLGQQFKSVLGNFPVVQLGDLKLDTDEIGNAQSRTLSFSIETNRDKRNIFIVISLDRLKRTVDDASRRRLLTIILLGPLWIFAIAIFVRRLTQPVTELSNAARKVTAGELDFRVPVAGPEEVSRLSATFNEMLVGLRRNRELEDQLQRAERSAVVGRLASGIAHEIRNPLNFINLSIDHLQASFPPKAETQRAQYDHILTTIKDEIARLNQLVSDFLSYGRPAKLKLREIDAQALVAEVRALVSAKAEQQQVNIQIESTGAGSALLQADPEQLKTCFSNLMINAVQAMPDGGSLTVTVRPDPTHIVLEFTDTGVGIPTDALQQIFEPYYSTKDTGIGLGLPLTKKIIEEHGGQIAVASEIGQGTTFTVTLQRAPQ